MRRVLLTGGTGFIGSEFLRRMMAWSPDVEAVLLVRDKRRQAADERIDALLVELFGDEARRFRSRIRVVAGDLVDDRLSLDDATYDDLAATITEIWHFAADVRFDQPVAAAREVQVGGTLNLAALARAAVSNGQFSRFHYVSTYATARGNGQRVREEPPVMSGPFRNSYEQTKAEAESALLAQAAQIPLTIHRIGIVVGDSRTGWTPKFDVFYFPIRLLLDELDDNFAGIKVPILSTARVNAVAVDDVADALYVLAQRRRGESGEILHLLPGPRAPLVPDALAKGMRLFIESRRALGLKVPQLPQIVALDDVSPGHLAEVLGTEVPAEVLDMVMQVMSYAFDSAIWETDRVVEALAGSGVELRPIDTILRPIIDFPVRTSWGAIPEPRPPLGNSPI